METFLPTIELEILQLFPMVTLSSNELLTKTHPELIFVSNPMEEVEICAEESILQPGAIQLPN